MKTVGPLDSLLSAVDINSQHHKFIASDAANHIFRANVCAQALAYLDQQAIPYMMAIEIVYLLEMVEVTEEQCHQARLAAQVVQRGLDPLKQAASIQ